MARRPVKKLLIHERVKKIKKRRIKKKNAYWYVLYARLDQIRIGLWDCKDVPVGIEPRTFPFQGIDPTTRPKFTVLRFTYDNVLSVPLVNVWYQVLTN